MYELKKNGKVFTSKFVGTGPSSYKKNLPGHGLAKVEKHWARRLRSDNITPFRLGRKHVELRAVGRNKS